MLFRRPIPRVAAAALVFGGGCTEDSNVSPEERASVLASASSYCDSKAACDPIGYTDAYVGENACEDLHYAQWIASIEDITSGYGEACGDAQIAYFECLAAAFALDNCYADPSIACADEIAVGYASCGGGGI